MKKKINKKEIFYACIHKASILSPSQPCALYNINTQTPALLYVYRNNFPLEHTISHSNLYPIGMLKGNVLSGILSDYTMKKSVNEDVKLEYKDISPDYKQFNLNLFNNKSKHNPHIQRERKMTDINNYEGEPKHHPPAVKEWFNSIYVYNNNMVKLLPSLYKITFKLVKSYFNFYSIKLENNNIRSRRPRLISKRRSTDRMFTSKPELKHKSEEITLNSYVYNRQNKNYINKDKQIGTIDNVDHMLPYTVQIMLGDKKKSIKKNWPSNTKMNKIKDRSAYIKQKINKQVNALFNTNTNNNNNRVFLNKILRSMPTHNDIFNIELFEEDIIDNIANEEGIIGDIANEETKGYKSKNITDKNFTYTSLYKTYIKKNLRENKLLHLKHYVARSFRKEKLSIRFKQLMAFNNYKFKEIYLRPFSVIVGKVLKKKINFNFVNLKYVYLNSYIFTTSVATKVRNKKNRLLSVLKKSLLMFKLPPIDRLTVYNEMYNKQKILQNIKVMYLQYDNEGKPVDYNMDVSYLNTNVVKDNVNNIAMFNTLNYDALHDIKGKIPQTIDESKYNNNFNYLLNSIMLNIKNKNISGVRIEAAGRLTRRNTAARSISKLRYIGNIRNMDSSYKGLSCVLLKGYEKSNLQYTNLVSKLRIGSYSIKGWVNSN